VNASPNKIQTADIATEVGMTVERRISAVGAAPKMLQNHTHRRAEKVDINSMYMRAMLCFDMSFKIQILQDGAFTIEWRIWSVVISIAVIVLKLIGSGGIVWKLRISTLLPTKIAVLWCSFQGNRNVDG